MEAHLARWPNGDVSLVVADSREDACLALDEVGDPFQVNLISLEGSRAAVHFKLSDEGELIFEGTSEMLSESLAKALPRIHAERCKMYEEKITEDSDVWKKRMRCAVDHERTREYGCNAEDAAMGAFGYEDEEDDLNSF